jgi:predicted ATPase
MLFQNITVSNFKSFRHLDVDLGPFNVVIGANASGKSNFVQIFRFLKDIQQAGLRNAISMQGGVEYLRNVKVGSGEELKIAFTLSTDDQKLGLVRIPKRGYPHSKVRQIRVSKLSYSFSLQFNSRGEGFSLTSEQLTQDITVDAFEGEQIEPSCASIVLRRRGNTIAPEYQGSETASRVAREWIEPFLSLPASLLGDTMMLQIPLLSFGVIFEPRNIAVYDIDPRIPKQAIPITGKSDLEEDGSNLAIVLDRIVSNKQRLKDLYYLITYLLPFVEEMGVERLSDKRLLLKLKERFYSKHYLPASFVSDGTIHVIALLVALFMEDGIFCAIEEPERNIHPSLMSRLVELMKDASKKKQVLVTTHNPEFVRYAGVENLLLISRDENGFSVVSRPASREDVGCFLKNNIGIDDLYVQRLLGG